MAPLLAATQPSAAGITRALLSVDELAIPKDHSITAFKIETWGVALLAICHLPPSWEIRTEKFEDPEGFLSGRSDIHGERLSGLGELFLVDVYDYQPFSRGNPKGDYHPASFAGWVELAAHPGDPGKQLTLHASNFRLTNAERCPEPPPPEP
jgi:hypothetical protein